MKDILIFGAGGFGREVAWTIEDINDECRKWNIIGFIDDNKDYLGKVINGYEVFSAEDFLGADKQKYHVANGIGNCYVKYLLAARAQFSNLEYVNLIHPSVIVHKSVKFTGEGIIVQAGSIIAPNVVIKSHVTINLGVTVGHDSIISNYSTIAPGVHISGYVNIGYGTDIGTGSAIIQGLNIGKECIIGANAAVVEDIADNNLAVGVPAKVIKNTANRICLNNIV